MAAAGLPTLDGASTAWNPGAVSGPLVSLVSTSGVSAPEASRSPAMIPNVVPGSWRRWIRTP